MRGNLTYNKTNIYIKMSQTILYVEVGYWKTVKYDEGIYCRRFIRQPEELM